MDLQFAFLCDEAVEETTGKLNARGIFHDLFAPDFPALQESMTLVVVLEWDRRDQGRYGMKAEIIAPDGSTVLTADGHSDVDSRPPERPPARTRLVLPLERVVFPRKGRYHLRVTVKGRRFRGPSLHLIQQEEQSE